MEPLNVKEQDIKKDKEICVELLSNKNNKFLTSFKNKEKSLFISSIFNDGIMKIFFEADFPLEKIKENKVFNYYESIDEILQELSPLINEAKVKLEENGNAIEIIFELPLKKFQKVTFKVVEKEKSEGEKIIELYNIAIKQNKEIKI